MPLHQTSTSDTLAEQCRLVGLPLVSREWRFHPARKWRIDVAFVAQKLAVEIEGITYGARGDHRLGGRHVSATGFKADIEKYNALAIAGWRLLRVLPSHVTGGQAVAWIEEALR